MKSLAKAESVIRTLKEKLNFRVSGSSSIDTVRETKDSNGWPMLFLSDGAVETAGNPVIAIRIKAQDAISKDILGNSLDAYTPHTLEFAYELDGTEGEPSRKDITKCFLECSKVGMKIEVKEIADATAVSATSMDATAAALSLEYDVQWPTKGN